MHYTGKWRMKERKVHECMRSAATDNARPTLFKLEKGGGVNGMKLVMQQIADCGSGKITYGGWEDEWWRRTRRHVARRQCQM